MPLIQQRLLQYFKEFCSFMSCNDQMYHVGKFNLKTPRHDIFSADLTIQAI
jgi:hypothetical protein